MLMKLIPMAVLNASGSARLEDPYRNIAVSSAIDVANPFTTGRTIVTNVGETIPPSP
eukprot:CAMPEP_0204858984 /NCGR_PEP_ID=MMETSP1347-20130617/23418_1 /ASSEMBLY_ACC=CAM_ASM_000690 /TAXON_ID=215587 /ORGANISM="Aplanochytrium stocchinoi, Strain GSBS06" /LENGTH=56 /DNA_ID=CAMNT_0052007351 /DNA_START=870 /DNA_END=1043 /DNA_ORIENTATION=-